VKRVSGLGNVKRVKKTKRFLFFFFASGGIENDGLSTPRILLTREFSFLITSSIMDLDGAAQVNERWLI